MVEKGADDSEYICFCSVDIAAKLWAWPYGGLETSQAPCRGWFGDLAGRADCCLWENPIPRPQNRQLLRSAVEYMAMA